MEWISVSERLPELEDVQIYDGYKLSKKVLVFNKDFGIRTDFTINGIWLSSNTHWANLPEPPKDA